MSADTLGGQASMKKWQQLNSEIVLDTPYFSIRKDACRLPNGHQVDDYYVLQAPNIALIVTYTPDGQFVLVEQYKHGIGEICLEIPGGMCESETDILAEAKRELREETGYIADEWHHLATFANNSTRSDMQVYIYLALNAVLDGEQDLDPNEEINIHRLPKLEIMPAIRRGDINVPDSVGGLMLALDWLDNNRVVGC
jgi:ADP-ribose pyrophosphatase